MILLYHCPQSDQSLQYLQPDPLHQDFLCFRKLQGIHLLQVFH